MLLISAFLATENKWFGITFALKQRIPDSSGPQLPCDTGAEFPEVFPVSLTFVPLRFILSGCSSKPFLIVEGIAGREE
jgi:hypothetical protein